MQHCCLSCTAEERQGSTSVRQGTDAAVSVQREEAHRREEVRGSVEVTPIQQETGLDGPEQTLESGDPPVVLRASSSHLPGEEGRTVERQPCAVLSGGEQPVHLLKVGARGYCRKSPRVTQVNAVAVAAGCCHSGLCIFPL